MRAKCAKYLQFDFTFSPWNNLFLIACVKRSLLFALCGQFVVGRGNTTFVLELPVNFYGQDNLNIYNQVLNIVCALSVTVTDCRSRTWYGEQALHATCSCAHSDSESCRISAVVYERAGDCVAVCGVMQEGASLMTVAQACSSSFSSDVIRAIEHYPQVEVRPPIAWLCVTS